MTLTVNVLVNVCTGWDIVFQVNRVEYVPARPPDRIRMGIFFSCAFTNNHSTPSLIKQALLLMFISFVKYYTQHVRGSQYIIDHTDWYLNAMFAS